MGREELKATLEFILNGSDPAEFEVVVKAVQRRQKEMHLYSKIGGVSPQRLAKDMSKGISEQFGATMEGLQGMARGFVEDIIRKNAPGISEKEVKVLADHYLRDGKRPPGAPAGSGGPGAKGELPPEALLEMVKRFVSYSAGAMLPSEQQELWEEMPRWQDAYWRAFPPEIKAFIESFLSGKISQEEFWGAALGFLGL
jgi:hypothetical protein